MSVNRILVTGGAGFIGSSLVDRLLQLENHVTVFDNLSKDTQNHMSRWYRNPNFEFVKADMLDKFALMKVASTCNLVFHLAANPSVQIGGINSEIDYQQNLLTTYNLLEAMKSAPSRCKKIIFMSSSTVYGEPTVIPTPEDYSPLKPISLYGATKLASESLISGYCHLFNLSGIAVRLANVIGPRSDHGVIHDFVTRLSANNNCLEILGDGKQNKSYLYISDCINALIRIAEIECCFEVFNVGCEDRISVLHIAEIVIKELRLDNVELKYRADNEGRGWKGDVREMLLDSSRLAAFGWKPKYNSRQAVYLTVREFANRLQTRNTQNR